MEKAKRSVKKSINKIVTITVIVILIALTATVIWMFAQIARGQQGEIFGYKLYVVVSDSMTPELNVGDVILSKSAEGENIEVGDVVTFLGQKGSQSGKLITHKVIEAPYLDNDGNTYLRTQGVKENAPKDSPIQIEHVQGVMVKKLAATGFILRLVMKPMGFVLIIAVPLMLLALYQLYRLAKMSAKKKQKTE